MRSFEQNSSSGSSTARSVSWKRSMPIVDISTGERFLIQMPLFCQQATFPYLRPYRLRGSNGASGSSGQLFTFHKIDTQGDG